MRLHPVDVYVSSLQCIIYPQSNGKSGEMTEKSKRSKLLGEDTEGLKTSALLLSSSAEV